jgi:cytochrome c oxidase subunit II
VRRGSVIQLAAIGVLAAVIATVVALAIPWLPVAGGKEAERIHFVYWFTTAICIGVFAVVAAVLSYSVWKFRVKPDDDADGPPTHGHTKLEVVWTAVPAVLVTAISIVSAIVLAQNSNAGSDPLVVNVTAQQFAWTFKYPSLGFKAGELHMVKGTPYHFKLQAKDVIHSFWVPQFRMKKDAVPGITTDIRVTPTRTGTYTLACTELCGLGHATMRAKVVVEDQAAFDKWAVQAKKTQNLVGGIS